MIWFFISETEQPAIIFDSNTQTTYFVSNVIADTTQNDFLEQDNYSYGLFESVRQTEGERDALSFQLQDMM
jgi:hypothetical protein